jgi:MYXO-CTERM domain-containing protein
MARHDAKRTGATAGTSNLVKPVPYWRAYLGGAISGRQMLTADANGDGKLDFVLANTGRISTVQATDAALWSTSPAGIGTMDAIVDLDGDGKLDIVAHSRDHVLVFAIATGTLEWREPDGEMGTIGSVRVGDVTGDGKPDVIVTECGCCAVESGNSGYFWSFGGGFGSAQRLGSLPVFTCSTSGSVTLVNADPASKAFETLAADDTHFALISSSGSVLAQTGTIGTNTASNVCTTANIDGAPGDEAVCVLNSASAPATNQRRVTALHYDPSAQPPSLSVLWSNVVAPDAGGDVRWADLVADLDGDGTYEVIVSTNDPTNGWRTQILDALTGNPLVQPISGEITSGTLGMASKTGLVLVTSSGTTVEGWTFARMPTPAVKQQWSVPNVGALAYPDVALADVQAISNRIVGTDLDGDGLADIVLKNLSTGSPPGLVGYSGAGGSAHQIASLTLPKDLDVLGTWIVPPMTTTSPQVLLARTDGILNLLDGHLQKTSAGSPSAEVDVHVGGYYATGAFRELYNAPRLLAFGTTAQSILVDDSRNALERFDATQASMALPPAPAWEVTHTFGPTVVPNLDGTNAAMACLALTEPVTDPPQYRVRAVRQNGAVEWDHAVANVPINDLAPGNFNGDSTPDFALQVTDMSTLDITTLAFSGTDGSTLWTTQPMFPGAGGFQSAGVAVEDWNADGTDDVVYQGSAAYVLSGKDGSQVATGGPTNTYSLPVLADTTGSGQDEVIVTSSLWPVSVYSHDLRTAIWTSSDSDLPYPYGALATCSGAQSTQILVQGSWQHPARLKLTPMGGTSLGSFSTIVLAGGALYATEAAAMAAGAFLGQLTSANVHPNLTGTGHPTAVIGSADGWLYAVNPCAGTLDFAVQFGAPVGEGVFGDTDGDGNDEILVTAADGYLYDLKQEAIAAPAYVWDTDPDHGITNKDVDSIVTTNKLSATWASVTGATSYEVEVVTADGKPFSMPEWKNVGLVTSTSLSGLPLTDNTKYFFAVRAVGSAGVSVDAISNGVTVHFPGADAGADGGDAGGMGQPDASVDGTADGGGNGEAPGSNGGCGCRATGGQSGGLPALGGLIALGLLVVGRVRVRRRR